MALSKNKTTKDKDKVRTLKDDLDAIEKSYTFAKNRIIFDKSIRTFGKMAQFFGYNVVDESIANRPITLKDLDLYKRNLILIYEDKYKCRRFIEYKPPTKTEQTIQVNDRTVDVSEVSSIIDQITREDEKNTNGECETKTIELERVHDTPIVRDTSFNPKYKDQKATLFTDVADQLGAARDLWKNYEEGKWGQLLLAEPGAGKTIVLGSFIKNFIEQVLKPRKINYVCPYPVLYVTAAPVVAQTEYALKTLFNIDVINTCKVSNIEMLRSSMGRCFVRETVKVEGGKEIYEYTWLPFMRPILIIWDESQKLAREQSKQAKISFAANRILTDHAKLENGLPLVQIEASATPFSRLTEARHLACSTGESFQYGLQTIKITDRSWKTFANDFAAQFNNEDGTECSPEDYNRECIAAFAEKFSPYIVRIGGINPKFKAYNGITRITFKSTGEQLEVETAIEKYQERKRKIEGSDMGAGQMGVALLAEFIILRRACEHAKRYHFADWINENWEKGLAPGCGFGFKQTITSVSRILIDDYGWSRDDISIIWGGSTEALSAKQKFAKKIKESGLEEKLKATGLTLEDIGINFDIDIDFKEKNEEQYAWEKAHRMLTQSKEERERERLRFQRQDSRCMLFTFKAGGTGLNAQHEPMFPRAKQRTGLFSLVYSEKELLQGLGRFPRITSCSDTSQTICGYKDTIEDHVLGRVVMKLKCMKEVIKSGARDSWEDLVTGKYKLNDIFNKTSAYDDDEDDDESSDEKIGEQASEMFTFVGDD
jgi:hypothetical protein